MTDCDNSRRMFVARAKAIALEHFDKTAYSYDELFSGISRVHSECLQHFLSRLGRLPTVLDAACGTGRYFAALEGSTRRLFGIDQSEAMLVRARKKHPGVETRVLSLQALKDQPSMAASFDGLVCIDSMEWILRDDWPVVLDGFNLVLRPMGHAYITVEIPGEAELRELAAPSPPGALKGEIRVKEWYNHFPCATDVSCWLDEAGFDLVLEKHSKYYRHLLLRKRY